MDTDIFEALSEIAEQCFYDCHAGLDIFADTETDMKEGFQSKDRLSKYKVTYEFSVSENEHNFHLIGFMDAIVWMARNKYIDFNNIKKESDLSNEIDNDAPDWEREIMNCIITDAAMIYGLLSKFAISDLKN